MISERDTEWKVDNLYENEERHVMKDRVDYLGQIFMEDSQLHVISMEFKNRPYCTFFFRGNKKTRGKKVCK